MFGADIEDLPNAVRLEIAGKVVPLSFDYVDAIVVVGVPFVGSCEDEVGVDAVLSLSLDGVEVKSLFRMFADCHSFQRPNLLTDKLSRWLLFAPRAGLEPATR